MRTSYIFTSESVSEGHPDKVCDKISDTILDAFLKRDPEARVAVETVATTNFVALVGEVRPDGLLSKTDMEDLARKAIRDIGYAQDGFHWQTAEIDVRVHAQSVDIAQGVDAQEGAQEGGSKPEGAGDQGIMFGYACRETQDYMPAPIAYAHRILKDMADARKKDPQLGFGPDSKSQVSLRYEDGKPIGAESIVVSTQHEEDMSQDEIRAKVRRFVEQALPDGWMCAEDKFFVNPTGKFVIGGPDGDAGLTGRKIIVDSYGGTAPHGGGAFSGKDPTKVDRSAAYAARYLAKNTVAAGLAERCTIQLSYAIGVSHPLSIYADLHNTQAKGVDVAALESALGEVMDLSPKGIRTHLELNRPIYARTAAYGHFGRAPEPDGGFSWERTDLVDAIKKHL